jgi:hypothetical protein
MQLARLFFNPGFLGLVALIVSIVWMLRDEKDKTRPLVVFAILINLFYGTAMTIFLAGEGSLLPWKYDLILFEVDRALGVTAAAIALPLLHSVLRNPLLVVYESLLPVMILCCFFQRRVEVRNLILRGYVAELVVGPTFYAILPACGPVYAFGPKWLYAFLAEPAHRIQLNGFPNAFPSLHVATAFLFVLFARRVVWRVAALAFLVGTMLSTLTTGEHYVIDWIGGLAFGCFAGAVAWRNWRPALVYLFTTAIWSVSLRFRWESLLAHPYALRFFALVTVMIAIHGVLVAWDMVPGIAGLRSVDEVAGLSREGYEGRG